MLPHNRDGAGHAAFHHKILHVRNAHVGEKLFVAFQVKLALEVGAKLFDELYRDFSRSLGHVDVSGNDDFAAAFGHAEQFAQGFVGFRQKVDYVARDNRVKAVPQNARR